MRPVGSAAELERRRRRAIQLLDEGKPPGQIAAYLGCSRSSVYRWWHQAARGPEGLNAKRHPGPAPGLVDEQLAELAKALRKGPTAHGWTTDLWTSKRVATLIRRRFGVSYTPDHALRLVKKRLGWSFQKPERRARERNEVEIERWKREEFPRIKKRPA